MSTDTPSVALAMANNINRIKQSLAAKRATTPLWVFLYLYEQANEECYPSYMAGAKSLYRYLSPIEIPDTYELRRPKALNSLCSYETQELEKITGFSQDVIVNTFIREVMPRLRGDIPL